SGELDRATAVLSLVRARLKEVGDDGEALEACTLLEALVLVGTGKAGKVERLLASLPAASDDNVGEGAA
ncbi:hypothetical protein HK405_003308, partial [Cladochytrium tenue]